MLVGQVQFRQNVGNDILWTTGDGLLKLRHQLTGRNAAVVLTQAGLQSEIQFTATHGLGKEIAEAVFTGGTFLRGQREKRLQESIAQLDLATQGRELVRGDLHGNLNACSPASPLHIEDAGLGARVTIDRLRSEEQSHAIGRGIVYHQAAF